MIVRDSKEPGGTILKPLVLVVLLLGLTLLFPDLAGFVRKIFGEKTESAPQRENPLPALQLGISARNYALLENLREEALQRGLLSRSQNDMVSALLSHDGEHHKVSVRLKGDFVDHFGSSTWSWRVHLSGDDQILGLRRFSLQSPKTRGHHFEALLFSHLRAEGLLAPRYEFVDLSVNGRDYEVMALEEHFSKELLEAQGRREGVIVRFDEDEFWKDRNRTDTILGRGKASPETDYSWRAARIRPFRWSVIERSPVLAQQAATAIGMLRALQENTMAPSRIFDVDATGKFLALHDVWGYWHGLRWHNLRFYLNPMTLRLEPIGYDATSFNTLPHSIYQSPWLVFARLLLSDPNIYSAYRHHLARLTSRSHFERLITRVEEEEAELVTRLRSGYPITPSARKRLSKRMAMFADGRANILSPAELALRRLADNETGPARGERPYPAVVHANLVEEAADRAVLELSTVLPEDVQVTKLTLGSELLAIPLGGLPRLELPLTLGASSVENPPHIVRVPVPYQLLDHADRISGEAVAPSQPDRTYAFSAQSYPKVALDPVLPAEGKLVDLLERFPFLKWSDGAFQVAPGSWTVSEPLIIPSRIDLGGGGRFVDRPPLHIEPGTQLRFDQGAFVLSFGACEARGSEDRPIVLTSRSDAAWNGLVILGAKRPSVFEHVIIRNTDAATLGPWRMTGGATFYETQVTLEHVEFRGSHAEDAVNIVRSVFTIDDVEISAAHSDALDIDFSRGRIENSVFADVGGDAVDLSGSEVFARDIVVTEVRDKGISAGEGSTLELEDIRLQDVDAAIVSKDLSVVEAKRVTLRSIGRAAFMAYVKKPEYGPGALRASDIDFDDSADLGVVQYGSRMRIDGEDLPETHVDVESLYAPGLFRNWW